jgi:hypothetical protein
VKVEQNEIFFALLVKFDQFRQGPVDLIRKPVCGTSYARVSADFGAKRQILETVFLNLRLDDVSLCYEMGKPFDALAKGLLVSSSRGAGIELSETNVLPRYQGAADCLNVLPANGAIATAIEAVGNTIGENEEFVSTQHAGLSPNWKRTAAAVRCWRHRC